MCREDVIKASIQVEISKSEVEMLSHSCGLK